MWTSQDRSILWRHMLVMNDVLRDYANPNILWFNEVIDNNNWSCIQLLKNKLATISSFWKAIIFDWQCVIKNINKLGHNKVTKIYRLKVSTILAFTFISCLHSIESIVFWEWLAMSQKKTSGRMLNKHYHFTTTTTAMYKKQNNHMTQCTYTQN